jgi:small basic protein
MTVEGVALRQLSRSTSLEQIRLAYALPRINRAVGPVSVLTILIPGLYMMATSWGWRPWIVVALISWALIAIFGTVSGIRLAALERVPAPASGGISPEVQHRLRQPVFMISWRARIALGVGVVFLMTIKPGLGVSLLAVVIAVAIGLTTAAPALRRSMRPA